MTDFMVGDTVTLTERYADLFPGAELKVVGIQRARDPNDGLLLFCSEGYSVYSRRVRLSHRDLSAQEGEGK